MKFLNSNKGNIVEVTVHEDASLNEVLEMFEGFLRACGYVIPYDEYIQIVEKEK